jgi:16S rRNA (adenine1518-N6/adenine1519-N6)-dimethyltransferase
MSIKQFLEKNGIPPKKSLGQNFCIDGALPAEMARRVFQDDLDEVWEVGPGLGALTERLLEKSRCLRIFEIDQRFRPHLEVLVAKAARPVTVQWGDFLKYRHEFVVPGLRYTVCGNLPYYCGTAIVRRLFEADILPQRGIFLLQDEVAQKMAARPGHEDYGFLSVSMGLFARVVVGKRFAPSSFYPNPTIYSSILEVVPLPFSETERELREKAERLASAAFQQRRKMLVNTIGNAFTNVKEPWKDYLGRLGISVQIRPERLTPEEFVRLAENLL